MKGFIFLTVTWHAKTYFTIRSEKTKKVSLNVVFTTLIYSTWVVLIYNSFQAFSATYEKRGKETKHAITQEVAITRFTNNQNLLKHAHAGRWERSATAAEQRVRWLFKDPKEYSNSAISVLGLSSGRTSARFARIGERSSTKYTKAKLARFLFCRLTTVLFY